VIARGGWGETARMSVEFKQPVPIGHRIRGEGWVIAARRRVYETAGHILDPASETILATATSTFVVATGARREALAARYGLETPGSVDR
jgi:acyl-CoA thioesterase FadM